MGALDLILEDSMFFDKFWIRGVKKSAHHKLRWSLMHFEGILHRLRDAGLLIIIVPFRESRDELLATLQYNREVRDKAEGYLDDYKQIAGLVRLVSSDAEACSDRLILVRDTVRIRTITHELFHFVHMNILSAQARLAIKDAYHTTLGRGLWLARRKQYNENEFFAVCGEFYCRDGFLRNTNRVLEKRQPGMHDLIRRILAGEHGCFE